MRTVAGQIQNYSFPVVDSSINTADVFAAAMTAQIGEGVSVQTQNVEGNEHFGFAFGSMPLPDLAVDIPIPAGSAMSVEYALDEIVRYLNSIWDILTFQKRRCRVSDLDPFYAKYGIEPDASGPVELKTLTLSCSFSTITTTIVGEYLIGHELPAVTFSIAFAESITVLGTVPSSTSLTVEVLPAELHANLKKLNAIVDLVIAAGAPLAGIFGVPIGEFTVEAVQEYILSQLKPISGALNLLPTVVGNMPQRIAIPGTTANLIFHYDSVSIPQGTLASSGDTTGVTAANPGAVIAFSSKTAPVVTQQLGFVQIEGPTTVKLPRSAGPQQGAAPFQATAKYQALVSDQAESPTFKWTLTSPSGAAAQSVSLSNESGQEVTVAFNQNSKESPSGIYVLTVAEDDLLHLKDAQGNLPTSSFKIDVSAVVLPPVKPQPPPKLK